jgi:demethylmenaquinone methyltransferase/2-methoxy-6-polyprenyl-1,4-benzoquinol methylase
MNVSVFVRHDKQRQQLFGPIWSDLIPKVFADVPEYYDKGNALASLGLCGWWSNRFAREITVMDEAVVLDVCSGTHDVARRLLGHNPKVRVFAVDRSPEMTRKGQSLAKESGLSINAAIADAHVLPYVDATFDAVTLQFATRHLRVVEVFREIHRVLKPGGVFHHNDMLRPRLRIIEKPYLWYLHLSLHMTAILFGSKNESKRCVNYFTESIRNYLKPDEMANLLQALGFEDVRHRSFLTGVLSYHIARKPRDRIHPEHRPVATAL